MTTPLVKYSRILQDGAWIDPTDFETISMALREDRLAWAHLDGKHPDAAEWVSAELDYLDLQAREALLDVDTRPRIKVVQDGVILILRGINDNDGEDPEDMASIRIYADEHRIVTVARKRIMAIERMEAAMDAGHGPQSAGDFLVVLIEDLVGHIAEFQAELDAVAEDLELKVVSEKGRELRHDVAALRLQVIAARRYVGPQRDALRSFADMTVSFMDPETRREIDEEAQKMTRIAEDMDELRDQAVVLREELSGQLSDQVNKNTFVLSVLSAIFLPLGFITGLFGVNVGGMPGVNSPIAFWLLSVLCLGLFAFPLLGLWIFRLMNRKPR
ncbi:hypothetical protein BVC71_06185 [Marivivens niveibacter]|uniref:Zinc transporter ZntB n=1 Tax=Marivivens niveibacter TaxID=1930667 RepID=A0A251WY85_9RHOB|nr:zinc transporter ZntB [Marivivens niveibacter]OUD09440.1 hypothetical protein BVC71_06185 [Marivivens niveibacter]